MKNLLLITFCMALLVGCETFQPLPARSADTGSHILAVFKVSANGKFMSPISYGEFGDEPLELILKSEESGKEIVGKKLYKNFVFFPNVSPGKYKLEKANSMFVFRVLLVENPVIVSFGTFSKEIEFDKSGVDLVGSYIIETKQKDLELDVTSLKDMTFSSADISDLKAYIEEKNKGSGWNLD